MDVGERGRVEVVEELLVPHRAEQADPLVPLREPVDAVGVLRGVRRGADDHERLRRGGPHVALDDLLDVVLGLEARDDEVVPPGSSPSSATRAPRSSSSSGAPYAMSDDGTPYSRV